MRALLTNTLNVDASWGLRQVSEDVHMSRCRSRGGHPQGKVLAVLERRDGGTERRCQAVLNTLRNNLNEGASLGRQSNSESNA